MKYAILSDIHGNLPAIKAALADAESQGADKYLLLGDYTNSFPWGNGVSDVIRGLKNAVVIRGNGEGYIADLLNKDQAECVYEQFKPVYWAYHSLSRENREYMTTLPEHAAVTDNGVSIWLSHSMDLFYRKPKIMLLNSSSFRAIMEAEPFTHSEYLIRARDALLSSPEAVKDMDALPKGVYLFGHNHLQFHMEYDGKLFINPGSCGEALDWDATAAYTLLDCEGGIRTVTERRVKYDLLATAEGLYNSGYTTYAPEWSEVIRLELMSGKDYFYSFVMHLMETGRQMNRNEYPVGNDVWDAAVKTWSSGKLY